MECRQTFQVSCTEDGSWAGDETCEPLRCSLSALRQLKSEFNTQILPDNRTLIHLPSPGGVGWGAQAYKAYEMHISVVFGSAVRLRCAQDYAPSNAGSVEPVCAGHWAVCLASPLAVCLACRLLFDARSYMACMFI